jgi:DNA-binding transcriptional LysR family regulator
VVTFFDHRRVRGQRADDSGGQRLHVEGRPVTRTTLRRLEVFVAVVEAGGFRACSDLLDISPAAVSHQINQLEEAMGTALFVRRRGRVGGLTEHGARAYREAKELLDHADTFENRLGSTKRAAVLRLSVFASPILDAQLAKPIAAFVSEYPSMEVALKRSHFEEIVAGLGTRQADVAYFYSAGPVSEIPSELAWREPISICARHDHAIFSKQPLTFADLREVPFVAPLSGTHFRRSIDDLLRRRGVEKYNIALETGHANIAREAVIGGFAISAVIARYLDEDLIRHGVRPVAAFENTLALEVRRAVRRDLVLDHTTLDFTRCLDRTASAVPSSP